MQDVFIIVFIVYKTLHNPVIKIFINLHIEVETEWGPNPFSDTKLLYFDWKFTEMYFQGSNRQ